MADSYIGGSTIIKLRPDPKDIQYKPFCYYYKNEICDNADCRSYKCRCVGNNFCCSHFILASEMRTMLGEEKEAIAEIEEQARKKEAELLRMAKKKEFDDKLARLNICVNGFITHEKFGRGRIINVGDDNTIEVSFIDRERIILLDENTIKFFKKV